MQPIRVLHMLPDLRMGGGQVLLLRNIQALKPLGVQSTVCALWRDEGQTMTRRFEEANVPVVNLKLRRRRLPKAISDLVATIREREIDLIHTNNTVWDRRFGVLGGRIASVPVVNSFHSMLFRRRPFLDGLDRWFLRGGYTAGVAVSRAVKEAWASHATKVRLPLQDIHVVHPGLDLRQYRPSLTSRERVRRALQIPLEAPVIVNVARFVPGKGHLPLLETMQSVAKVQPDARLVLIGDGPERETIENELRRLDLTRHVVLAGQRDDVPELVAAADLFAFTSEGEGFGLVITEAMACGIPVAAFELPVLREVVPSGAGILVKPGDCESLAKSILALVADPLTRQKMGTEARREVELRFTDDRSAKELASVYAKALGRPTTPVRPPEREHPTTRSTRRRPQPARASAS